MNQKIGQISRLIAAIYVLYMGSYLIINQATQLILSAQHDEIYVQLFKTISSFISFIIGGGLFLGSYAIFRNKRDSFLTIISVFLLMGTGGALTSNIFTSSNDPKVNPLSVFIFYFIPAILLFISWKNDPNFNKKGSIGRARNIFGDDLKHLSDEELHHLLKK